MLYIRIELWPHGDATRSVLLHEGEIARIDENKEKTRGTYLVRLRNRIPARRQLFWKSGRVVDFPRLELTAWDLLYQGLKALVGDRNDGRRRLEAVED
ncbi:MAG: hypothetical protein OEY69_00095 [Candidatus Krumholzibacteria bacterium]|nr:hypothetical protein [Candidatus Krumholzibacteria bacterium]